MIRATELILTIPTNVPESARNRVRVVNRTIDT
jgi:hypothetical protein